MFVILNEVKDPDTTGTLHGVYPERSRRVQSDSEAKNPVAPGSSLRGALVTKQSHEDHEPYALRRHFVILSASEESRGTRVVIARSVSDEAIP